MNNFTQSQQRSPLPKAARRIGEGRLGVGADGDARRTVRDELTRLFEDRPDAPWLSLVSEAGEVVYDRRQLRDRVFDYLRRYDEIGVSQGDIVLIILRESLDLFAAFLAGVVYGARPAYFAYPSPKQSIPDFLVSIEQLVRYNDVRAVVGFAEVIEVLREETRTQFDGAGVEFIDASQTPTVGASPDAVLPNAKEEAFLQFSSGTTGAKKGVLIQSDSLFRQLDAYGSTVSFDERSRVVSWLPHYHDMGLIACMLMPLLRGAPIVMMSPFEWVRRPAMLLEAITRHRGTHVWLPNFALGHLVKSVPEDSLDRFDLSSLSQVVCCSEPILRETVEAFCRKFAKCRLRASSLRACYAMAENTFAMTTTLGGPLEFLEIDRERFHRHRVVSSAGGGKAVACVGPPLPNVQVRIVDEKGDEAPGDCVGEICIRSDCMLDAYHNNPQATAEAFRDGWFRTGDLGFLQDGRLYVTGRKKNVMIVGGENIYPQDVQAILNEQPGLIPGRNVVFGVDDDRVGTQRIVVLAEATEAHRRSDTAKLKTLLLNHLNVSVSTILFLPHRTLKKSTAGKISNVLNRQEYLRGGFDCYSPTSKPGGPAPQDENRALTIVKALVSPDVAENLTESTPLMTSGLIDSFAFAELIQKLERSYHIEIPQAFWSPDRFDTAEAIARTASQIASGTNAPAEWHDEAARRRWRKSLDRLRSSPPGPASKPGFWEWAINRLPFPSSVAYRFLLRRAGVRVGENVAFLGRIHVKIRGAAERIEIGDDVILGDGVDLRNRENGRIVIGPRVYLDANVRLVAAREGCIEIGFGTEVGANTVINSGGETRIGQFSLIASNVNVNASRHGTSADEAIKSQPHQHGPVTVGDDVWIGSGASLLLNTQIEHGAVVSSNSVVSGRVPSMAVCAGVPAKVIQFRAASREVA